MTDWEQHRLELLRAFKNGPQDIEANRAGRLGSGQGRRMRRGIVLNLMLSVVLVATFVAIVYFAASRPLRAIQWILIVLIIAAGLALGVVAARNLLRAVRSGVVECLEGPVRVATRGRSGWWITVQERSFHIPVAFWHVGAGVTYRVYVAAGAQLIVAMEPAEESVAGTAVGTAAEPDEGEDLVAVDCQTLRAWAQGLCMVAAVDSATVLTAIGLHGELVETIGEPALEPAPAGTSRVTAGDWYDGLFAVRITPAAPTVSRRDLDAEFGTGSELVRIHWDSAYHVIYWVTVAGAPFRCDITASFTGPPIPANPAVEIALRRQRVQLIASE
ncbi:mechanosensitive ion channel family protein [Streptomyces sp. So13.3]|uniref:mechanosensitive ion channel family protein n=1 Tax=Streptomyces TaxID=1883 RepID=UPI0011063132|nr:MULTISPECIES: mechanosensitive ion channel family protein [Streptomyces]MCZ4096902.1 mechanosensitive ion channel family protein [Streptomyces sp. H39-C1]QNA70748.1 mechanosensitive ion channel family protein [Streptomyces sp. So13.3]